MKKGVSLGPRADVERQLADTRRGSGNQGATREDSDIEEHEAVQVCGNWLATKGECRVLRDHMNNKLAYAELAGKGVYLHGFFERSEALAYQRVKGAPTPL